MKQLPLTNNYTSAQINALFTTIQTKIEAMPCTANSLSLILASPSYVTTEVINTVAIPRYASSQNTEGEVTYNTNPTEAQKKQLRLNMSYLYLNSINVLMSSLFKTKANDKPITFQNLIQVIKSCLSLREIPLSEIEPAFRLPCLEHEDFSEVATQITVTFDGEEIQTVHSLADTTYGYILAKKPASAFLSNIDITSFLDGTLPSKTPMYINTMFTPVKLIADTLTKLIEALLNKYTPILNRAIAQLNFPIENPVPELGREEPKVYSTEDMAKLMYETYGANKVIEYYDLDLPTYSSEPPPVSRKVKDMIDGILNT